IRSLFPASCLAATKRQSITSSRACPLAVGRSIRLTFTCLSKPCPLEGSDIPVWVTTTARPGLTLSRTRNQFLFRRPTWPSNTCSRRTRRKRSRHSASGLNTRYSPLQTFARKEERNGNSNNRSTTLQPDNVTIIRGSRSFIESWCRPTGSWRVCECIQVAGHLRRVGRGDQPRHGQDSSDVVSRVRSWRGSAQGVRIEQT